MRKYPGEKMPYYLYKKNPLNLKPVGANQTEIELDDDTTVFFSYATPVAVFIPGKGVVKTSKKWSVSTSKHINKFIARTGAKTITEKPQEFFDKLVDVRKTNPKGARAFDARKIKSNKIPSKDTVIRVRHLYVSGIGKEKIKQDFSMNDKILDKILSGDFGKGKHTRKNPKKKTRYFIQAKKGKLTGLFTGKISLTDDIHKAAVYDNKEFAVETAGKLNRNFPAWKWSVIPASSFKR